jgi:hypothetical protein
VVTLLDQFAWVTYSLVTRQYGFLLSTAGYAYVAVLNLRPARRYRSRSLWIGSTVVTGRMKRDVYR